MSEQGQATVDVVRGDFSEFLKGVAGGRAACKCQAALERVVRGVCETGKAGSVTLKMVVEPLKGSTEKLHVGHTVAEKVPQRADPSVFFPRRDGTLTRAPEQTEFGQG